MLADWAEKTSWVDFLAVDPATRSNTSVCLKVTDPGILSLTADQQAAFAKALAGTLDAEGIAYDIGAYRDATVRSSDLGRRDRRDERSSGFDPLA